MYHVDKGWLHFLTLCQNAKSRQQLNNILTFFLTAEEKQQLADRVLLIKALLQDKTTQREIAANLQISIAKITRGSNQLKTLDNKFKAYLKKAMK